MAALRVVVIGGGIAGLSTAIALRQLPQVEVEIYEQADQLREIGAQREIIVLVVVLQAILPAILRFT
jgi:2-polyprenyl-6-methoxyphenol hydroxylase-like FAD-dependent oxidoreductase